MLLLRSASDVDSSARFGNLSPFGLLFEQFGGQYFALETWQFGYFLGYFWKIVKKLIKPVFSIIFRALMEAG